MISYGCLIVIYCLTQLLYEIYAFENLNDLHIALSISLKVNVIVSLDSPYMVSY